MEDIPVKLSAVTSMEECYFEIFEDGNPKNRDWKNVNSYEFRGLNKTGCAVCWSWSYDATVVFTSLDVIVWVDEDDLKVIEELK